MSYVTFMSLLMLSTSLKSDDKTRPNWALKAYLSSLLQLLQSLLTFYYTTLFSAHEAINVYLTASSFYPAI